MKDRKNIMIVIILITGFVFGVSFSSLYAQTHITDGSACGCTLPIPVLIPTFSSLGMFIGSIVYYLMFPKIENKKTKIEENLEIYRNNIKTALEMMDLHEKIVIESLIDENGKVTQSKLSKKLGKVKAFRTIESLRKRGILEKERNGKTNFIKFTEKFRSLA